MLNTADIADIARLVRDVAVSNAAILDVDVILSDNCDAFTGNEQTFAAMEVAKRYLQGEKFHTLCALATFGPVSDHDIDRVRAFGIPMTLEAVRAIIAGAEAVAAV